LVAVDRSAKAIAATARNAGRAEFVTAAQEDIDPAAFGRFDKILTVNVNLFWVRPPDRELQIIADLLCPGGKLLLCYEPPDVDRLARLEADLAGHLERAGYRRTAVSSPVLLAVTARRV
jgi:SAM-dependent methyltransferase